MTVTMETIDAARMLSSLPVTAREALSASAREIEFSAGERLIPLGQAPQRLIILTDGLVKLVGVSANGHERILSVHRPGDLVGPSVLLDGLQQDYEATAMSAGRGLAVSRRDLLILSRSHPSIILLLAKEVSRLLSTMTGRMMAATSSEVPVRLSQLLLDFADGRQDAATGFVPLSYPLTHEAMAQIVGASRPHTSTVLRDLEEHGAVRRKSRNGLLVRPSRLRVIIDQGELTEVPLLEDASNRMRPDVMAALSL
ncbi:MAG TPA: Crp/Fnr family transcriptional regulator [Gemmatimonadota bacterium]|nr:Crp/Fnr family transcriptional regulator [Gemmatimonadota bacterium]